MESNVVAQKHTETANETCTLGEVVDMAQLQDRGEPLLKGSPRVNNVINNQINI